MGRLSNGAHYLYVLDVLSRAQGNEKISAESHLVPLIATLKAAVEEEDANLKTSQKSFYTDDIATADGKRDSFYGVYKRGVQNYLDFPDTDMAEAAKILWQHIKDYGIDPKMQLDKETGLLINFIGDLQSKYAEQVETLSLTNVVEKLDMANAQVQTATAKRTEERMGIVTGAMKAARQASDNAYRALVKMVNALALVNGDEDYADFIDYVNTQIAHYKQEVIPSRSSSTKEESAETEAE